MARDIAASFNHLYGDHFTLPEAAIEDNVALLPGLDGRKMSKSYDNTIPLFVPRDQLRKLIMGILTDSKAPGEPKSVTGSAVFQLFQAFASAEESSDFAQAFAQGIAWGDAKQRLFERLDQEIAPLRTVYDELIQDPARIEQMLQQGAAKARAIASPFTARLRHAVGLRRLDAGQTPAITAAGRKVALPSFKQYREADNLFYFKLVDTQGQLLLQSTGFESPKAAAQSMARIRQEGLACLDDLSAQLSFQAGPEALKGAFSQFSAVDAKS
jgi:tryptophanyl-tRNA synthetase